MRALTTDLVHILLSLPVYLVGLLLALAIAAFRKGVAGRLYRWRYVIASCALASYLASAEVCTNAMLEIFESRFAVPGLAVGPGGKAPTILVLTAGYPRLTASGYRAFLSADGLQRVIAGVEAWRRTGGALLFSGAPTPDFTDSMAHEMARTAAGFGVPKEAILIEPRSGNTYENLLFSQQMLRERGRLDGPVILVVSAFQMSRAVAVARKLDLAVVPFPCDFRARPRTGWQDWIPSNDGAEDFESIMHELIGFAAYRFRGWI